MKLSNEAFNRAQAFIFRKARPLERSLNRFHFTGDSGDVVHQDLIKYHNLDGGFGNGLEPDLRLPASSAIATTVAMQVLRRVRASEEDALVKGAMRFLLSIYDAEQQVWPIIPPNDNSDPHAPWWFYDDDLAEHWRGFKSNPRAEILGYLYEYPGLSSADLRQELTEAVITHLEAPPEPLEVHDLLCYVRLVETKNLPEDIKIRLVDLLFPMIDEKVARTPEQWAGYCMRPLDVALSPNSPFLDVLADSLPRNLDYLIQSQGNDGAWSPTWSWGPNYPDVWPQAEREWKGVLTQRSLRELKLFDRLGN
ncbi:MAG: hypothetical protein U9R25_15980 [Chloroflexota bacterium]|nr:hypothetical protein [Chloroflexota bacterium]